MKKNATGRSDTSLVDGIVKANALIGDLSRRDGVDTEKYGFLVRQAGAGSMMLHRGLHPAEDDPSLASAPRDPRLPKARQGLSIGGSLKKDLIDDIRSRHDELVRVERWSLGLAGRPARSQDFRWDPVLLSLLKEGQVDLDCFVAMGPGEFVSRSGARDHAGISRVVDGPTASILGCIDGDAVRAMRIRYEPGVTYSWSRTQPDHVELTMKDRPLPQAVAGDLIGEPFSTVFDHASLALVRVESYARAGSTTCLKSAARLVRP